MFMVSEPASDAFCLFEQPVVALGAGVGDALDTETRSLRKQLDNLTQAAAPSTSAVSRSRTYADRRISEGLSMPETIRCQKRYLARKIFHALHADYAKIST